MNHHVRQYHLWKAIAWLRERGKYCFGTPLAVKIYTPVHGIPLGIAK